MQGHPARRVRTPPRRLAGQALIAVAVLGLAACAGAPAATSSSAPPSSSRPPSSSSSTPPAASTVSCVGGWHTGSTSVTNTASVPPVPVATGIRVGSHADCKFDRLVVDFSGAVPGYVAGFVAKVIQDPSGKTITMPGSRFLVIKFSLAQAYNASAKPTLPTMVTDVHYPMLRSYDVAGDFEGVLTIALGLAGNTKYRIGELTGEVYIDVAWPAT